MKLKGTLLAAYFLLSLSACGLSDVEPEFGMEYGSRFKSETCSEMFIENQVPDVTNCKEYCNRGLDGDWFGEQDSANTGQCEVVADAGVDVIYFEHGESVKSP